MVVPLLAVSGTALAAGPVGQTFAAHNGPVASAMPLISANTEETSIPVSKPSHSKRPATTYSVVTLGCPKNLVDTERMLGLLQAEGHSMTPDPGEADIVVVNTCGFIEQARQESLGVIQEMLDLKEQGKIRGVIVAGCLAQRDKDDLLDRYPGIDQLVGVFGRDEIAEAVRRIDTGSQRVAHCPSSPTSLVDTDRMRITPPHTAYLRIAEGCDRVCAFCSIPSIRGKYVTKPIDQVVTEAEQLAADGVRELNLIAQDTTYYGIDRTGKPLLAELLARLDDVSGLEWIRLMYAYPVHFTDELIDVIASARRILPYIDLPLQHINDEVLGRMKRQVNRAGTEELLDRLRRRIPQLAIRTSLIVGFPGETVEQFEELETFVRERRFERLGVFEYSREQGTSSDQLDGHLNSAEVSARRDRLLTLQQEIAFARNAEQVGQTLEVILDRCISEQEHAYLGRTRADAPEIDQAVYVTGADLAPGRIVDCEIVATQDYDLIGVALGEGR